MDSAPHCCRSRGGAMRSVNIDVAKTCDELADRAAVLHYYAQVAATVLGADERQPGGKCEPALVGALVLAHAILDSADVCSARLERIADTLDDLMEALERKAEGGEVPTC